jgi:hypothetical protein
MDPKRRRELALGVAAVVLAAIAVWMMRSDPAPQATVASNPPAAASAPSTQSRAVAELDLKALEAERAEPEDSNRNPFRFKPRTAPAPSPSVMKEQQQQAAAAAAQAAGPAEPPPPPRIPLKYIGEMADPKQPGRRVAILSDTRGVYYGREGDVIEGRYQIVKIGVESIELAYIDGRGRQVIRQTGQ